MYAAIRGELDRVRLLVEAGADPNAVPEDVARDLDLGQYRWTAERHAAAQGHWAVVDYLAPLTGSRARGKSPLRETQDDPTRFPLQGEPFDEF
jgi:hypothetical protein